MKEDEVFRGYDTIELFNLSTDMLLSSQMPEVIILAILSNYPKERLEVVLRAIVTKLKQLVVAEKDRNRFVNQLFYLSRLRKFEKETKIKLEKMLIEIDIKDDHFYKEGREEGIDLAVQIIALHNKGKSAEAITKKLNISVSRVQSIIKKFTQG